jgi:hypothetical protein
MPWIDVSRYRSLPFMMHKCPLVCAANAKGQDPSVVTIYRALAEHEQRQRHSDAVDLAFAAQQQTSTAAPAGVRAWLAADELHDLHTQLGRVVEHVLPARAGHRPVRAGWAGLGHAV